ncbi:MAG: ABC transporter ATP-binding protein, partial [Gammaproteobacteria bacterium]
AFHQRNRTGELLTRIAADTEAIRDLFSEWALTILIQSLTLLAMMAIMLWINWRLSLVAIAVVPALFFVLVHLNRKIRHNVRKQRRQEGRIASTLSEVLGSMAVVQAFGRQSYEHERFVAQSEENLRAGVRTARSSAAVTRAVTLVSACGVAATVIVGARHVVAGLMTPGELLIFVAYVNNLYKPIRHIGKLSAKVFRASVSAQRIDELLRIEPDLEDHPSAGPAPPLHGTISFDGVTFGYAGKAPILNELNLTIEAGTLTAIVGASGSGKSTLVSLLLRLYDPAAGCITVDGVDVADWTRESVRRQVGCVLQDVLLFDTSVAENIAYGSPGAGATAIEQAARAAGADAFIRALPQGYDSVLGERAATLSGGQRQRLSLARALLKDPPILVLDEPTSAIDAAGVSAILDTLTAMRGTKTIVVVTHDLHDMARFDQIVVLAQGRVVEQGTHAGLLRRGGHYASLQRGAASRAAEAVPPATTAATNMRGRGGM